MSQYNRELSWGVTVGVFALAGLVFSILWCEVRSVWREKQRLQAELPTHARPLFSRVESGAPLLYEYDNSQQATGQSQQVAPRRQADQPRLGRPVRQL